VVFQPTRGDRPLRFGPGIPHVPPIGPATLDAAVYHDPQRYELERTRILNRSWQIICRSDQIPNPGDHHVWTGHGENIVITRRPDGGLAGFHNVCQHRGAQIVARTGTGARRYTCRWHNWSYDIEGKVTGVPDRPDFDRQHLENLCAPTVDLDEWGGWIWAVLAGPGAAGPLTDWLAPDIAADLDAFHMQDMKLVETLTWTVDVNWKVCIDSFNEYYKAGALHGLPSDVCDEFRESTIHVSGRNGMMVIPFMGALEELRTTLDHSRLAMCSYQVFPTSVISAHRLHTQLYRAVPLAVDRTRFEAWELVYDTDDDEYNDSIEMFWAIVKGMIEENVQQWQDLAAAARSSANRRQILSERECLITHFHRVCDDIIAGGDGLSVAPTTSPAVAVGPR
jgi:phenylpropionate dioxygenase-like ring-hydroxylating dioxygenase large terminal subunit